MAGRICKHDGCGRPVAGRGMCKKHYEAWRVKNPGLTMMETNRQALLDAMPATIPQMVEKTGLTRNTVNRQLSELNVNGPDRRAHIYDWKPPAARSQKWQALYREGNGPNKRLTPEMKREHNLMKDRIADAKRRPPKAKKEAPGAGWAAALFTG